MLKSRSDPIRYRNTKEPVQFKMRECGTSLPRKCRMYGVLMQTATLLASILSEAF